MHALRRPFSTLLNYVLFPLCPVWPSAFLCELLSASCFSACQTAFFHVKWDMMFNMLFSEPGSVDLALQLFWCMNILLRRDFPLNSGQALTAKKSDVKLKNTNGLIRP